MNIEDFNFHLPEELIAQTPLKERSASRLLVLNKETKEIEHKQFTNMIDYLRPNDCLVLNDTRVIPARLHGIKTDTGAKIEMLLLHQQEADRWEVLVKPAKKIKVGTQITFGEGILEATCIEEREQGGRIVDLSYSGVLFEVLDKLGEMPLPPYIKTTLSEKDRYQTVYAKEEGSAAAPTAGLHFTPELLDAIKTKGIEIVYITLHVGLGTFRPVSVDKIEDHHMHAEYYHMTAQAAQKLNDTRQNNGRIIAVGTTSARTLETIARDHDDFVQSSGWTDIYIYPPYQFLAVDGLITNFHLPKSTLTMLVSSLTGIDTMMHAYEEAITERYRFFSFGDAMFITS